MLERAKEATRCGKYTYIEYARFADDLVILIDAYPRHDWLMGAVEKRLREELADLQVEINEEKSRNVDLGRGESFGFLGFDFRRIRSRRGVWRANYTPKLKKRTALLRKLKDVFRRYQSQPVDRVYCACCVLGISAQPSLDPRPLHLPAPPAPRGHKRASRACRSRAAGAPAGQH